MRTETLWLNSPWNNAEEVRQQLNFAEKIQLHDVTLRDGEQQAGLVFSHDDKIAIAERLAEVGIHHARRFCGGCKGRRRHRQT